MKNGFGNVQFSKALQLYGFLGLILFSTSILESCSNDADGIVPDNQTLIEQMPSEPISEAEKASLIFMREEEKLARDVYVFLFDRWNLLIFDNIAASEQSHTDAVLTLLNKYSITDPAENNTHGVFTDSNLQALYTDLTTQGSNSLLDALVVGATIEDLDISDLNNAMLAVDNADIQYVYNNLNKGSRNHLRSFYSQILSQNGTYEPQYISQEEFNEIVNSPIERGNF